MVKKDASYDSENSLRTYTVQLQLKNIAHYNKLHSVLEEKKINLETCLDLHSQDGQDHSDPFFTGLVVS